MRKFEFIIILITIIAMIVGFLIENIFLLIYGGFGFVGFVLLIINNKIS